MGIIVSDEPSTAPEHATRKITASVLLHISRSVNHWLEISSHPSGSQLKLRGRTMPLSRKNCWRAETDSRDACALVETRTCCNSDCATMSCASHTVAYEGHADGHRAQYSSLVAVTAFLCFCFCHSVSLHREFQLLIHSFIHSFIHCPYRCHVLRLDRVSFWVAAACKKIPRAGKHFQQQPASAAVGRHRLEATYVTRQHLPLLAAGLPNFYQNSTDVCSNPRRDSDGICKYLPCISSSNVKSMRLFVVSVCINYNYN